MGFNFLISQQTTQRNENIELLFEEINRYKKTKEKQQILLKQLENENEIFKLLITSNMAFAVSVAKQYQNQGLSLSDLISESFVGLVKAAKRFDRNRGVNFITYAIHWQKQSILDALPKIGKRVRIPSNLYKDSNKIKKGKENYWKLRGQLPNKKELASLTKLTMRKVENACEILKFDNFISLDCGTEEDNSNTPIEKLKSDYSPTDEITHNEDTTKKVRMAIDEHLTELEKKVVIMNMGLYGYEEMSFFEIARKIEVNEKTVLITLRRALRKLRNVNYLKALIA